MARLPQVGGDSGSWGEVLNEYLSVSHNTDGTLKSGAVSGGAVQDGSVTIDKLAQENAPMSGQVLSYSGTGLNWTSVSGGGAVPDANATTKGLVQLAGDLSGTAAAPTVPGLAGKEDTVVAGTTAQYYRGDKSWQALNKAAVGLGDVDNTSDANKPISTATQTALNAKADTSSLSTVATSGNYNDLSNRPTIPTVSNATSSTPGVIQLTGDLGGTAASPTVPGLAAKENTLVAGTSAQYYRGDKSWQTLNKAAVGLANVDNTSDASKPISSATQTALDAKAATSHVHAAADITSGIIATARLPIATDTASGVVELATSAEAITGVDTTRAVTPAGLKASVDAALSASPSQILFVDAIADVPPGTPVDTLIVVRAA